MNPTASVFSYGTNNSYGHPNDALISRLQSVGSDIYSTALSGDIVISSHGNDLNVNATPNPTPEPVGPSPVDYMFKFQPWIWSEKW